MKVAVVTLSEDRVSSYHKPLLADLPPQPGSKPNTASFREHDDDDVGRNDLLRFLHRDCSQHEYNYSPYCMFHLPMEATVNASAAADAAGGVADPL